MKIDELIAHLETLSAEVERLRDPSRISYSQELLMALQRKAEATDEALPTLLAELKSARAEILVWGQSHRKMLAYYLDDQKRHRARIAELEVRLTERALEDWK